MSLHTALEPIANFTLNQLFNLAPFKRTEQIPKVTIMQEPETLEITYDRGVEIKVVAVAKVEMKNAYVITASRGMSAGNTFKLAAEKRLVPVDLFIGWGLMSSPFSSRFFDYQKVYDKDGGRTMVYRSDYYKISRAGGLCAHVHFMNPNDFRMPKHGDCVSFEGFLVDIYMDGVCTWPTDLIMGDENCETVYPTQFKIL